jgi:8-oxo-dGTP pyrophosphatase MutT (NUDIX family)
MWLMTDLGFFSIVQKPGDKASGLLTIRSRVRTDLEALGKRLAFKSAITEKAGTDYPYRVSVRQADVAAALAQMAADIDYSNFKDRVKAAQGPERAAAYSEVWGVLYDLEKKEKKAKKVTQPSAPPVQPAVMALKPGGHLSAGGVLIDDAGRVLLREPTNHFGGYVWTFAKGRVDPGETPEQAALREVREETGYRAEIVEAIPGQFEGTTGSTVMFVMRPIGTPDVPPSSETNTTKWVTFEEAKRLIGLTTSPTGRKRDLSILQAALESVANSERKERGSVAG